ncbi:MAG: hypothetical protein ABSH48_25105 [Verrucomicrobiota bacterium]|jgi:hypothetical protein
MKITSINGKESNEFNLELNTEPKLEQAVFDHFRLQAARNPKLKDIAFSRPENSDLILHTGAPIDSVDSQGLASLIEDLLTESELLVARECVSTERAAGLQDNPKNMIIEAAGKKLGIPVT